MKKNNSILYVIIGILSFLVLVFAIFIIIDIFDNTELISDSSNTSFVSSQQSNIEESDIANTYSSSVSVNNSNSSISSISKCSHEYYTEIIKPTCNTEGYTVHKCSKCGYSFKDTEVPATHTFEKYKCVICGQVDEQHTYQYLVYWILEHGTTNGNYCSIVTNDGEYMYSINYDKKYDTVTLDTSVYNKSSYEYFFNTSIAIPKISNTYTYYSSLKNLSENSFAWKYSGKIQSNSFTETTPLSYDTFDSDISAQPDNNNIETSRINIILTLINAERILTGKLGGFSDSGISIDDLGFKSFAK